MASGDILLSSGVRSNLLALQSTANLISRTQTRLATGKAVNSALDDAFNFFTSKAFQTRAADLSFLLSGMDIAVKTLEAADKGIDTINALTESAEASARQALTSERTTAGLAGTVGGLSSSYTFVASNSNFEHLHQRRYEHRHFHEQRQQQVQPAVDHRRRQQHCELQDQGLAERRRPAPARGHRHEHHHHYRRRNDRRHNGYIDRSRHQRRDHRRWYVEYHPVIACGAVRCDSNPDQRACHRLDVQRCQLAELAIAESGVQRRSDDVVDADRRQCQCDRYRHHRHHEHLADERGHQGVDRLRRRGGHGLEELCDHVQQQQPDRAGPAGLHQEPDQVAGVQAPSRWCSPIPTRKAPTCSRCRRGSSSPRPLWPSPPRTTRPSCACSAKPKSILVDATAGPLAPPFFFARGRLAR